MDSKKGQLLSEKVAVAVLLDISNPQESIFVFDLEDKKKFPVIVFFNENWEICFELGFGRINPYSRKLRGNPKTQTQLVVTPAIWEIIKLVVKMVAKEKKSECQPYFTKTPGKKFWNSRRTLVIYEYRGLFQRGLRLTISKKDAALLNEFFIKEPRGDYWRRRIGWFVRTTNALMGGTTTMKARGLGALELIL